MLALKASDHGVGARRTAVPGEAVVGSRRAAEADAARRKASTGLGKALALSLPKRAWRTIRLARGVGPTAAARRIATNGAPNSARKNSPALTIALQTRFFGSIGLASVAAPSSALSIEPPDTDPYVRWCGRGGVARRPPIPIPE